MDDFPIFVTDRWQLAIDFVKNTKWEPSELVQKVFRRDATTPCCMSIVTFDASGQPADYTVIRDVDEEDDVPESVEGKS